MKVIVGFEKLLLHLIHIWKWWKWLLLYGMIVNKSKFWFHFENILFRWEEKKKLFRELKVINGVGFLIEIE